MPTYYCRLFINISIYTKNWKAAICTLLKNYQYQYNNFKKDFRLTSRFLTISWFWIASTVHFIQTFFAIVHSLLQSIPLIYMWVEKMSWVVRCFDLINKEIVRALRRDSCLSIHWPHWKKNPDNDLPSFLKNLSINPWRVYRDLINVW